MPNPQVELHIKDHGVITLELDEAKALSFYATLDEATLELQAVRSVIERVDVSDNLRTDVLEAIITPEWLEAAADDVRSPAASEAAGALNVPPAVQQRRAELAFLWRLAQQRKAQREEVRGKPETFTRPDFTFRLLRDAALQDTPPDGNETVQIDIRRRGAPLCPRARRAAGAGQLPAHGRARGLAAPGRRAASAPWRTGRLAGLRGEAEAACRDAARRAAPAARRARRRQYRVPG